MVSVSAVGLACTRVPSQNKDTAKSKLELQPPAQLVFQLLLSNSLSNMNMPLYFCTLPLP